MPAHPSRRAILIVVGAFILVVAIVVLADRGRVPITTEASDAADARQLAAVREGFAMMDEMKKANAITREDCENHEVFIESVFWRMAKYEIKRKVVAGLSMACFGKSGYKQVKFRDAYSGRELAAVGPWGGITMSE